MSTRHFIAATGKGSPDLVAMTRQLAAMAEQVDAFVQLVEKVGKRAAQAPAANDRCTNTEWPSERALVPMDEGANDFPGEGGK